MMRLSPVRALLVGTLAVGTLDILDAFIFFGLRGAAPIRILQSIASGVLGRAAFQGGAGTAALGALLHYTNALLIVLVYHGASRWLPMLTRRAVLCGIAYGIGVYFVMTYVVVPLSAAGQGAFSLPVFINGILIHMVGVGLPAALSARAAAPPA